MRFGREIKKNILVYSKYGCYVEYQGIYDCVLF